MWYHLTADLGFPSKQRAGQKRLDGTPLVKPASGTKPGPIRQLHVDHSEKESAFLGAVQGSGDRSTSPASPHFREYVTQTERRETELAAAPSTTRTVFIDEVQRVPALLDGVQAIIDAHPRRFRFYYLAIRGNSYLEASNPVERIRVRTEIVLRLHAAIAAAAPAARRAADLVPDSHRRHRAERPIDAEQGHLGGDQRVIMPALVAAGRTRHRYLQSTSDRGGRHKRRRLHHRSPSRARNFATASGSSKAARTNARASGRTRSSASPSHTRSAMNESASLRLTMPRSMSSSQAA
jgi:hypothetical protein